MKKLYLTIPLMAILAAGAAVSKSDKEEVMAAMDTYKQAMIKNDSAALKQVLADDVTYVHSNGALEHKADVIKGATSGSSVIERIDFFPDTVVRVHGSTAYVTGKVDLYHSATNIVHMNVLHVWEKGAQGWKLVARQATKLP
jgi:ketosteroid isomerase-like protein